MVDAPPTRTEVHAGDGAPVVVRVATGPAGRLLLAREADRLGRARHPGVVSVLEHGDTTLTLAWAGTETLATARLPLPRAAAVLAVVADTVADLHDLGLVHGRLDPSHVVLGADHRPRLCGMRGVERSAGAPTPGPPDDVAGLGRLIDHVVGAEIDLDPIPDRRWSPRPRSTFDHRALATLADRATATDPSHRPTARALAAAIVDAVPSASLHPARTAVPGPAPRRRRWSSALAVGLVVLTVGAVASATTSGVRDNPSPAGAATVLAPDPQPEPTPPSRKACPATEGSAADLDGDGCPERYRIDGTVVEALGRRFEAGRPGDLVAVADWDCDGRSTVAVLRPGSGEVFVFRDWDLADGPVTVRPTALAVDAVALRPGRDRGCTTLAVGADGSTSPLELDRIPS